MTPRSWIRKLFARKPRTVRKAPLRRRPGVEVLEDRLVPAVVDYTAATKLVTFTAEAGEADNVVVTSPADHSVRIVVAGGDSISLTGNVSAGFTLSPDKTQLDIDTTKAAVARFDLNLGDMNDTLALGLANATNGVTTVNVQGQGGTDNVTVSALTISGDLTVDSDTITLGGTVTADNVSLTATDQVTLNAATISGDLTVVSDTITLGGTVAANNVSLTAVNSLTGGAKDAVADIVGHVVTLNVTGAKNSIGVPGTGGGADIPLQVDVSTQLNATTADGHIIVDDVAGNLPLGQLNAGGAMILLSAKQAITDANFGAGAPNLTAAGGVNLTTTGSGSAIGTDPRPIRTAIGALSATTNDGGIYVSDSNGPGLAINTVLVKQGGMVPYSNGSQIVVDPDGAGPLPPQAGSFDVSIRAQGPVLVNSVTAPDLVTIRSVADRILDSNGATMNVLARSVNFIAGGAVGQEADPFELMVESFSASTANGGIFLAEGMDGTAENVVANGAGNQVVVTSPAPTLRIKFIKAAGNVTVASNGGSLLAANGTDENVTGQVVDLTGKSGIGTAVDPLETKAAELRATASDPAAGIWIKEKDGLSSVAAKTNAGDVAINFTGGPLTYVASTEVLSAKGAAVTFETTAGNVKLNLVDAGSSSVNITASGAIAEAVIGGAVDLRGGTVTLKAGTGIGASGNEIDTDVATLDATTTTGDIAIREANALFLSAASNGFTDPETMTGSDIDVSSSTGDMTLGLVSALGSVTLDAGGAILDGNGVTANVSANTLDLAASNGIGSGGDGMETSVNSLTANGGPGGGLLLANNKGLTLTSATATGGAVAVSATGNLTFGTVKATGQPVTLSATGQLIDGNGPADNVIAASATLNGSAVGSSGDKIETNAASITAATTSGGIFLSDTGGAGLTLTATALGQAANVDVDSKGSIVLNTATAQGDTVKLRADGSITDGNDTSTTTPVNIIAKTLDISAPGGIGTPANPLEVDVDQAGFVDGGAAGANLTNTGPLALTETALEAAGSGTLTFDAESITVLDIADNMAAIAPGRSVVLRTQTGPIVFLDPADTIQTQSAGTITVQAGTIAGSGGVAVLGNLKTAGGNILVTADRTITIGLLDAGTGDVTVQSRAGIILDGNGPSLNVVAGTTTLSGAAPTAREAELDETFRIAEAAAASAEAAAKQTSAEAFGNGSAIVDAAQQEAAAAVVTTTQASQEADDAITAQQNVVHALEHHLHLVEAISLALDIVQTVAESFAAPAQAVPVTGDGGAETIANATEIASKAADAVALAIDIALTDAEHKLDDLQDVGVDAHAKQFAAESMLTLATATAQAFRESSSIATAAAEEAAILRDASARVRDQAIQARDQANVIGTAAAPLGLDVAGVINVNAGPTDSFLQVVGATAVDLIKTTGSVTLISTGAISDADADAGADVLGTGLKIVGAGGIGTAADPLETRVATLNAANTSGGDIAIANTVGTPGALDITGISNAGGGDVNIANKGNTAAGQGITVSGPISATGAGAEVTIHSGSPLTVGADITSADAILLEAGETALAGDDLTVNPGVTIHSTGSGVTLRAGDNVVVPSGSTIQASTAITITADYSGVADAAGAKVVVAGTLVAPSALIGVDTAADADDTFTITPSATTPITVDAEDGIDTLYFNADGLPVTIVGNQITALGRAPVTFLNFEFVNITNASGGGSVTLLAGAGMADILTLLGTGPGAGTFTLNGGVPISFSGVNSFTFEAGDMDDTITLSPFATSVLPWEVAVAINGGPGTDRLTYNNVAGLLDSTSVTATAPQAGHIDSPGVTSALGSQLVTFSGIEDVTANANPGEDEQLTVNLRDTGAADTANLLFAPAPGAADLQLVGLFDLTIDTDNYVGLTLNGRGGDDTFNVTPGPIPVFVDGGDPIGATAGDAINFNPASSYVLEPGPQNDEGGLNAAGAQRVSWDHVEGVSVTGGGPGVFLGTNGDDAITVIARDGSTHAGADGVQDFTVSLNNGPSVLFLNTPVFRIDALAGDDDIELRAPAPNNAVWNVVGMTLAGNDGNDVINAATGVGSTSPITLEGGAGDDLLEGGPGNDRFFGNEGNDTFVGGAGNDTFDGGTGFDTVLIRGTPADDVLDVFQSAPSAVSNSGYALNLSFNGVTQTDTLTQDAAGSPQTAGVHPTVEEVRIEAGLGNDLIRVGVSDAYSDLDAGNGVPNQSVRFHVVGGAPNPGDRLLVRDDGVGDLVVLHQASDQHSGRVSVAPGVTIPDGGTGLADVVYEGIGRVEVTPLNSNSGGTGTDGSGRILVFQADPFEFNDTRFNAGQLARVGQSTTSPGIDPGGITTPFGANGDEDWYEFRPTGTNTYQIKILFDRIQTLGNGRPGLPGDGDLSLDIYDANGALITSGVADANGNNRTATFGATDDPAFPQFNRIFVRVKGAGAQPSLSINRYDFANLSGGGSGIPGGSVLDAAGPQVTGVNITDNSLTQTDESAYNLFVPKPTEGPTPLVPSLAVHFVDNPARAPGALYPALDPALFNGPAGKKPALGLFAVVGDLVGTVPIRDVVLTNDPVVQGQPATATVTIFFDLSSPAFAGGLPDDRYTLTIRDGLSDPSGAKLDGESNAAQPKSDPLLPSGDGHAGGDFVARFTVDSRPEIGTFGTGKSFLDLDGNGTWDPQGSGDTVHHDNNFTFGLATDTLFAGNFAAGNPLTANGYDKLGAYGKVGGQYRFLLDLTGDGQPDLMVVPTLQINGLPVAGDFAPNHPGQEIGLLGSNTWYLDTNGNNNLDSGDLTVTNGVVGLPIVGDFDGDGKVDLGAYDATANTFSFDLANNGYGQRDATIAFGFPTGRERPVAADMNRDGVTDIGLFVPRSDNSSETLAADWYFLVSAGTPTAGSVSTLNHAFNQTPFSNDRFFTFGDSFYFPIVGNFDPPVTQVGSVPTPVPEGPGSVVAGTPNSGTQTLPVAPEAVPAQAPASATPLIRTVKRGRRFRVEAIDPASGRVRVLGAFVNPVRVGYQDVNGDGIVELILKEKRGKRNRTRIFNGVDLTPLAPVARQ
jgi:hypothetical protein